MRTSIALLNPDRTRARNAVRLPPCLFSLPLLCKKRRFVRTRTVVDVDTANRNCGLVRRKHRLSVESQTRLKRLFSRNFRPGKHLVSPGLLTVVNSFLSDAS